MRTWPAPPTEHANHTQMKKAWNPPVRVGSGRCIIVGLLSQRHIVEVAQPASTHVQVHAAQHLDTTLKGREEERWVKTTTTQCKAWATSMSHSAPPTDAQPFGSTLHLSNWIVAQSADHDHQHGARQARTTG